MLATITNVTMNIKLKRPVKVLLHLQDICLCKPHMHWCQVPNSPAQHCSTCPAAFRLRGSIEQKSASPLLWWNETAASVGPAVHDGNSGAIACRQCQYSTVQQMGCLQQLTGSTSQHMLP